MGTKHFNADIVQTVTNDKLLLTGLYSSGDKSKPAILHIHGYQGDFYTNKFVHTLGSRLKESNIAFLSVQHRGTGCKTEFYLKEGGGKYIGSDYELLEEAHLDITAWIKFLLKQGYSSVILQGHSLGTIKVIRYLFEGVFKEKVEKLILLCPFDKNALFISSAGSLENLQKQIQLAKKEVEKGNGDVMAPEDFDDAPHSYANFLSWARQDDLGKMFDFFDKDYGFPVLNKITIPLKVIVGTKDEFLHPTSPDSPEEVMGVFKKHVKDCETCLIEGANHGFTGYENKVAQEVVNFID